MTGVDRSPQQFGTSADHLIRRASYQIGFTRIPDLRVDHENIDYFGLEITPDSVVSFQVRDSIDKLYRTGALTLHDRGSIRQILPITGNEIFTIAYKNHVHEGNSELKYKVIHFRVFHIEEVEDKSNEVGITAESYIKLYLVEFPIFDMFSYNRVYRTFDNNEGVRVNDFVELMLKGIPFFEKHYDIDVEPGPDDYFFPNMWLPRWSPLKMMNFLNMFMINQEGRPFYSFNIRSPIEGFGFKPKAQYKSIYSLFDSEHFREYSTVKSATQYTQPKQHSYAKEEIDSGVQNPNEDNDFRPLDTILQRNIHWGDANKLIHNASTGRTYLSYQYEEGNIHLALDETSFMKNYKTLGQYLAKPIDLTFGNQWSMYETIPYNSPEMARAFLSNKFARHSFKQMFLVAETFLNETRVLGEKAKLNLPTQAKDIGQDLQMSGRWMTWAVNDTVLADGTAISEVTFARDSFWIVESTYLDRSTDQYDDAISDPI